MTFLYWPPIPYSVVGTGNFNFIQEQFLNSTGSYLQPSGYKDHKGNQAIKR